MKILLINHYAGSTHHGMEYRPYYLSREWVRAGHEVRIVAADFSHLRQLNPTFPGLAQDEVRDGIVYSWLKTTRYRGNGLGRILNILSFLVQLVARLARWVRFQPSLVIASSTYPLDIFPSWLIARLSGARLVYEVHDLWPLSPMELGVMSKWHPFIMVMQLAEDFACRFSDKVVSLLPKADLHLRTRGMAPEKFSYAPNGIAVSELTESSESQRPNLSSKALEIVEVVNLARARGDFIVGYAGGHGPSNALGTLLESAFLLRNEPFSFVLVGDGVDKATLQEETKRRGLSKVYFQAAVPKSDIMGVLGLFDCLYCGFQKLPLYRFGVSPNKLMDYLMAAKPVVTSLDAPNDVVAEARSGFSVPAENSPAVAAAIRNLKDTPPTERTQMANRGREYVLANFSYQHIAHRFLDGVLAP